MGMASINFVVAAIVLCFSIGLTLGSLSEITSLTVSAVNKALPARISAKAFGNQASRFKRDVVTKKLDDPSGCVAQCWSDETTNMVAAGLKNAADLVKLVLAVKGGEGTSPEEKAAFKKKVEDVTIANMGPMFADFCKYTKEAIDCYKKCPDSQLRTIKLWEEADAANSMCEPGSGLWNNFSDYFTAVNCTNNTIIVSKSNCDESCGKEIGVQNVTGPLEFTGDNKVDWVIHYETDSKKNTAAIGPACKNILCHENCYKQFINVQCGQKASTLYTTQTEVEPRFLLRILNLMNAVGKNKDCSDFQSD